jgi:hypothetical protein
VIRYVHQSGGAIASAHHQIQPDYAEEASDDQASTELQTFLQAGRLDLSDADNLEKTLKAILLAAASMSGKTVAQARAAFRTAWQALPPAS